jgi:hydrogenase maturation protein HypF
MIAVPPGESRLRIAQRIAVSGLVQGVGFRPFVHRLAARHQLSGWVRNASGEVQILVEGTGHDLDAFLGALRGEAPPLARIDAIERSPNPLRGFAGFAVLPSVLEPFRRQPVSPDVAMCGACEAELYEPANRRYRHPFITCTDCGPRFTVIRDMPYDRERTSMAAFPQCPDCLAEYRDPGNRRYHSETNCCPACGPRLWFEDGGAARRSGSVAALRRAAALLRRGGVLALRGLGGFHLAVDATSEPAVARLRERKAREAKPLAVMVRTLDDARALAGLSRAEEALLTSPARPIVVVAGRPGHPLAPSVSPGLGHVGLMLAYTPLHHLLLDLVRRPLVMTSGNRSDEPIATANAEARERLGGIADGFLLHDREIIARYDDSVARAVGETPVFLRRARGYAPMPLSLPVAAPVPLVAVGPHLKNTFTLAHGGTAYVSQHIGDLESIEALEHFRGALDMARQLFRLDPEVAVRDRHPGYLSTAVAGELGVDRVIAVQHHHAHIAAVLAEHGHVGPVIGVAFDGTGYGDDGTVWGSEFLIADLVGYRRAAHLLPAPLPGGDLAARMPWRAALGYLSLEPGIGRVFDHALRGVPVREREIAELQIHRRLNAPIASSMGRLFDAAAAVIGVRRVASYEGQAAMELEALAGGRPGTVYPCRLFSRDGRVLLDPLPLLSRLGCRRVGGADPADLAADFHESIASVTEQIVRRLSQETGLDVVALSGGVFQNVRLLAALTTRLEAAGLTVLSARSLPPNDGAVSYGQAAVAAALLAAELEA